MILSKGAQRSQALGALLVFPASDSAEEMRNGDRAVGSATGDNLEGNLANREVVMVDEALERVLIKRVFGSLRDVLRLGWLRLDLDGIAVIFEYRPDGCDGTEDRHAETKEHDALVLEKGE